MLQLYGAIQIIFSAGRLQLVSSNQLRKTFTYAFLALVTLDCILLIFLLYSFVLMGCETRVCSNGTRELETGVPRP
jgi:hypothetical protein